MQPLLLQFVLGVGLVVVTPSNKQLFFLVFVGIKHCNPHLQVLGVVLVIVTMLHPPTNNYSFLLLHLVIVAILVIEHLSQFFSYSYLLLFFVSYTVTGHYLL